jgi:hypothetical protein
MLQHLLVERHVAQSLLKALYVSASWHIFLNNCLLVLFCPAASWYCSYCDCSSESSCVLQFKHCLHGHLCTLHQCFEPPHCTCIGVCPLTLHCHAPHAVKLRSILFCVCYYCYLCAAYVLPQHTLTNKGDNLGCQRRGLRSGFWTRRPPAHACCSTKKRLSRSRYALSPAELSCGTFLRIFLRDLSSELCMRRAALVHGYKLYACSYV